MRKVNFVNLKEKLPGAMIVLSLLVLFFAAGLFYFSFIPSIVNTLTPTEKEPEINYLKERQLDFGQLKVYFKDLSEKKGAVYAFQVLNTAPMPYGIDMHLLAHTVGDELYKQQGINGMKYCTDDFRNACSHSMVINLFYEKGETGIDNIHEACKMAPGEGAYSMCYHGLGHGVFAYSGYDFARTDTLCKKVAIDLKGPEYKECMGGAMMEQISGGDHDKESWLRQRIVNLHPESPLYPCMSKFFSTPAAREACLVYLTPYLWELAGKHSADVSDEILLKSYGYCNKIPEGSGQRYRDACFGGFGKEFLAMAKGKDVRHIDQLSDNEMQQIYRWCMLMPYKDGQKACIIYAQGSMYWSGANDKKLVEHFCALAPTSELSNYCFSKLIGTISQGDKKNQEYLKEFCNEIPVSLQGQCQKQLLK